MENKTGGPAYPYVVTEPPYQIEEGMTLRDYFAGQALLGYSNKENRMSLIETAKEMDVPMTPDDINGQFAKASYLMADAMIKEKVN